MSTYLAESLNSLSQSSAIINALTFRRTHAFSRAVLATEEQFETHLIRDAEPYELALFRPTSESRYDAIETNDFESDEKWSAAKRGGPTRVGGWEKASPLKERKGTAAAEDPERCLKAAIKLLDVYPLPSAAEHVQALQDQYKGLIDTMVEHEEALRKPVGRSSSQPHEEAHIRASDLEEAIKREQMEIFALEQIHAERQAELAAAMSKTRLRRIPLSKPTPPASGEFNPFAKSNKLEEKVSSSPKATPTRGSPARSVPTITPRATRAAATSLATSSPRSPVKSTPPAKTPVSVRSPVVASPKRTPVTSSLSRDSTPKPSRVVSRSSPAKVSPKKDDRFPPGVSSNDLEQFSGKLWATLGDSLRPWGRKTLQAKNGEAPTHLESLPFAETLSTLRNVVTTSASASNDPISPTRSQTTATTATDEDPLPPAPSLVVEYACLDLILSTLSKTPLAPPPTASLPPLGVTLRDPVLASSLATAGSFTAPTPGKKDPMVSMNALRSYLNDFAKTRGWSDDLAKNAIYALVSKQVLRIDRRGKEGPMLGFRI